jgi:hypothetical protein
VGWSRRSRRRIQQVLEDADRYVQELNDRFANPSGNPPLDLNAAQIDERVEAEALTAPAAAQAGGAD